MYIYASHDFERDEELKKDVYAYLVPPEKLAEVIKDADPRLVRQVTIYRSEMQVVR